MKRLPKSLAEEPDIKWRVTLAHSGLGGIAVVDGRVIFGDRDVDDFHDVWRCLDAETGQPVWEVRRLSISALDYGNSPRATPLIAGHRAYLMGGNGILLCVDVRTGDVAWEKDFSTEFQLPKELPWGHCGSPLIADGKLILAPGATNASLIALDPKNGDQIWKTPGKAPSYGSLIVGSVQKTPQIIGHDANSLGGWDPKTGQRLWSITPDAPGDFNVPTPLMVDGKLLVMTENNGTRLFRFDSHGVPDAKPVEHNRNLRPDMSSAVVVGGRIYCVNRFLYCLDLNDNLNELWRIRDSALSEYGTVVASDERVLVIGDGELLLLQADGTKRIESRQRVFADHLPVYSHPAFWNNRLYIRGENSLVCLQL